MQGPRTSRGKRTTHEVAVYPIPADHLKQPSADDGTSSCRQQQPDHSHLQAKSKIQVPLLLLTGWDNTDKVLWNLSGTIADKRLCVKMLMSA